MAAIFYLRSAQRTEKSAVIVINWGILWKSAVLNLFKNWRIVTQSDNALSDHGIDLLASKSTQNQNEEYAQPIVNY